jgi:Spx/MgsR family transcriptional regulator
MTTLYGIPNCDTVKKARKWLDDSGIEYRFHDFRKDGLTADQVKPWVEALGWETLVNKRSTTWKGLDDATKSTLNDDSVIALVLEQPTLIKRPLLDNGDQPQVGFKPALYQELFA